jgi:shikimate 5-dehydrogenase
MLPNVIYTYFDETKYWASMIHSCNCLVFSKAASIEESIKNLDKYGIDISNYQIQNTNIPPKVQALQWACK